MQPMGFIMDASASPDRPTEMRYAFTVVGFYESTGQIFCHHVTAPDGLQAFRACAHELELGEDALFVTAVEGPPLNEGEDIHFPGSGVVDAQTVLDQEEFGPEPCITTHYMHCNAGWIVQGCDSEHNDRCPQCNKEITPYKSEEAL